MTKKKRILIVDDEADSRAFTEAVVCEAGDFELLAATNGEEAIRVARGEHPDLIVLDVVMPGMNGISAFKHLQNDPETSGIPVIFLTGVSNVTGLPLSAEAMMKHLGAAPRAFLEKPLNPPQLLAAIADVFGD